MLEKRHIQATAGGLLLAFTLSAAGCSDRAPAAAPSETPAVSAPAPVVESVPSPSASSTAVIPSTLNQDKPAAAANAVQQAAANEPKAPAAGNPSRTKKTFEAYTPDKPLLMGVAIGEAKDKVVQLHGSPYSSYVMDDSDEPLSVAEYEGFFVGYNGGQLVEFVEVADASLDPGLNGLHLGQTTGDALQALGKPDASTDYVMTYRSKGAVLKLDIDPKTKTIQSIKLFRRTE